MTTPADPSQNGSANGQVDVSQLVQPRPVPAAWQMRPITFRVDGGLKHLVELTIFAATGAYVTYWDPTSAKRLAADLRGCAAEVGRATGALWTPDDAAGPGASELGT